MDATPDRLLQEPEGDAAVDAGGDSPRLAGDSPKSRRTRARILGVAMRLFAEQGYHPATNAVIAEAAGLTRGAMLYHFPTREALLEAAIPFIQAERARSFERVAHQMPTGADRTDHAIDSYWRLLHEPAFVAFGELEAAARTDERLRARLRDAQAAFPEQRARILGEITGTLAALLDGNTSAHMTPAEFVALYDDNADLLREGPWSGHALEKLADNLLALDLPARAVPILTRMLSDATDPARRAEIGAKLASVQLSDGSVEAAIATLAQSDSPALTPKLNETRQILLARADAAHGDKDKAVALLHDLGTAAAADLRATILSEKADWPAATAALADLARLTLPAPPAALDETQQKIVMRLANAATLAGDKDTIIRLAADRGAAMAGGKFADAFGLMTSAPVRTTSDISRAAREIRAAKPMRATGTP